MWKDIYGWEEYYEISDHGEIRNKLTGNLISGDRNNIGYMRVCLYHKGHVPEKQRFFRHRLVAIHFIPNPNHLPEVNHIDADITNNDISNLEWCSRKQNEMHSRFLGRKPYRPFIVTKEDGTETRYNVTSELADELHITSASIKSWLHNKTKGYKHYGIKSIQYVK